MKPVRAFLFLFFVLSLFMLVSSRISDDNDNVLVFGSNENNPTQQSTLNIASEKASISTPQIAIPGDFVQEVAVNHSSFVYSKKDSLRLNGLFLKLDGVSKKDSLVRIVYFGDSQIEGDRITSTLRKKMQARFGGMGPGLIPVAEYYNPTHQLIINTSKGWDLQSFQNSVVNSQSILFRRAVLSGKETDRWFRISRIKALGPTEDYRVVKLFYRSKNRFPLEVKKSGQLIFADTLSANEGVGEKEFVLDDTPNVLRFTFSPVDSLSLLGVSLESKTGLMVDNVSLRGLSYPIFTSSEKRGLTEMLNLINPGLFVFHFGVNLVPYHSEDYREFRVKMKQQISFVRKVHPNVPILIIGVSDMAKKGNGTFTSYDNIPQIKQMQREIAEETQSVFWDLQAFMGGVGSINEWVNATPPLAGKDYVHFTDKGAERVGAELARMLLEEYDKKNETVAWTGN